MFSQENRNQDVYMTNLECLPTELIELIFHYLPGEDVLQGFSSLNQRFDQLVSTAKLKTFNVFRLPIRKLTDSLKTQRFICFDSLVSLKLDNELEQIDHCAGKIEFFFYFLIDQTTLTNHLTRLTQIIFVRPIINFKLCFPDVLLQTFFVYSTSDRIFLRKMRWSSHVSNLIVCNVSTLRSFLDNYGGVYDHWLVSDEHAQLHSIISRVKHLKLYVDHYKSQWPLLSSLIIETISELSLIIIDSEFEDYDGHRFRLLFPKLSADARLHFYLQIYSKNLISIPTEPIVESFQHEFYQEHQSAVSVIPSRRFFSRNISPLRIFTNPLCVSQLTLIDNDELIDNDFASNATRLVFDPSRPRPNYNSFFFPRNSDRSPPYLKSIEFVPSDRFTNIVDHDPIIFSNNLRMVRNQIRHIHLNQYPIQLNLIPIRFSFNFITNLHFLDITDDSADCKCFDYLTTTDGPFESILHLNIAGSCYLNSRKIQRIRFFFPRLQTLRFQVKFCSSSTEQLDVIGLGILTTMKSLRYLHVRFCEDNLLIMTMIPSENQLGEWLGHNQRRLNHVQAIQLNRKELAVWL